MQGRRASKEIKTTTSQTMDQVTSLNTTRKWSIQWQQTFVSGTT